MPRLPSTSPPCAILQLERLLVARDELLRDQVGHHVGRAHQRHLGLRPVIRRAALNVWPPDCELRREGEASAACRPLALERAGEVRRDGPVGRLGAARLDLHLEVDVADSILDTFANVERSSELRPTTRSRAVRGRPPCCLPPHEANIKAAKQRHDATETSGHRHGQPSIGKCAYDAVFVVPLRRFCAVFSSGFPLPMRRTRPSPASSSGSPPRAAVARGRGRLPRDLRRRQGDGARSSTGAR